jgi:hypothetical protein
LTRRGFFVVVWLMATRKAGKRPPIPESLFPAAEIAEAERRANGPGPWFTTQEVLAHLKALEAKERVPRQAA